jgi:hypothetical protein
VDEGEGKIITLIPTPSPSRVTNFRKYFRTIIMEKISLECWLISPTEETVHSTQYSSTYLPLIWWSRKHANMLLHAFYKGKTIALFFFLHLTTKPTLYIVKVTRFRNRSFLFFVSMILLLENKTFLLYKNIASVTLPYFNWAKCKN